MIPRPHPEPGRLVDAEFQVLDRQVLDRNGEPVVTVDDVEITDIPRGVELDPDADAPVIENLLSGSAVLGTRLFGGRPPESRWQRIRWSHVTEIGTAVELNTTADRLDASWTERWVRNHLIGRIPGGRHAPD
ncbi:hypothetical protein [Schumannella soli]|uniref:Uncharacterized protein n=1 Tax=Schumannella soli TaxID=2590779 RepID=A0A506Y7K0_9MICO|nr:hypothetical protein [Schumannella soli]TPW77490.1 hypothetical protein FJ657_02065 [Schumannella soli]